MSDDVKKDLDDALEGMVHAIMAEVERVANTAPPERVERACLLAAQLSGMLVASTECARHLLRARDIGPALVHGAENKAAHLCGPGPGVIPPKRDETTEVFECRDTDELRRLLVKLGASPDQVEHAVGEAKRAIGVATNNTSSELKN
jgi:hypothetical protein